jgi:hypothetical protein
MAMDSEPFDRARRYAPVALAVAMLVVVTLVTATSRLHVRAGTRGPGGPPGPAPTIQPGPTSTPMARPPMTPGPVPAGVTSLLRVLFVVACVVLVVLLALLVVRLVRRTGRLRRRPALAGEMSPTDPGRAVPAALDAAVTAGLVDLADDADPRGAVINAWLGLERAAEKAGATRAPSDTPTDLATRLLGEHAVPADVLERLAFLYRAARYSPRPVDDDMRAEAIAALLAVQDALRTAVPAS